MYKIFLFLLCYGLITEFKVGAGKKITDFSKTVKSSYFVDKTLFIRDFLNRQRNDSKVKIITAPNGFGKSTITDMLRRFLTNEFNVTGKEVDYRNNPNYNIFCTPSKELNICKNNTKFIKEHFGRYPLVHIDFSTLKQVNDYKSLLDKLRAIVSVTYTRHRYLLYRQDIKWPSTRLTRTGFRKRMYGLIILTRENHILHSLLLLTGFLHTFFKKKVMILLEDYDSFWRNMLYHNIYEKEKIINVLKKINEQIFKRPLHMDKGLLTGILRIKDVGILQEGNNVQMYNFQGNHNYSKYYGITGEEVNEIVMNIKNSSVKRETILKSLKQYYNGYSVQGQENIKLYNILSTRKFFNNSMKLQEYSLKTNFIANLSNTFNIKTISDVMQNLIKCGSFKVDINIALSDLEIMKLNEINQNLIIPDWHEIELVIRLLYDLGLLTTKKENLNYVEIPNAEVQIVIGNVLTLNYINRYNFLSRDIEIFRKSINEFVPGMKPREIFKHFHFALQNLFNNSDSKPTTKYDLESILISFLAGRFPLGKRSTLTYPICFEGNKEIIDVILLNDHNMAVLLKIKFQQLSLGENEYTSEHLALQGHNDILTCYNSLINDTSAHLQTEDMIGATYIGIGFKDVDKRIAIVGSTFLFEDSKDFENKITYTY